MIRWYSIINFRRGPKEISLKLWESQNWWDLKAFVKFRQIKIWFLYFRIRAICREISVIKGKIRKRKWYLKYKKWILWKIIGNKIITIRKWKSIERRN